MLLQLEDIFTTQSVRERIKRPICIKGSLRVVSNGAVAPILPLLYFIIIILALLRKCVSANQFGGLGLSCHPTVSMALSDIIFGVKWPFKEGDLVFTHCRADHPPNPLFHVNKHASQRQRLERSPSCFSSPIQEAACQRLTDMFYISYIAMHCCAD